jgi:hypothetical protein
MKVKEYQSEIAKKLSEIFTGLEIKKEWTADVSQFNLYSPRLDIAIGPFAIAEGMINQYETLQIKYVTFIRGLIDIHNSNLKNIYDDYNIRDMITSQHTNYNPRCFIAIEIENSVSRKHLIGGAINASALGRFGLFIAFNEEKFNAMKKLEGYFNFLSDAKKNTFNTNNLFILSKEQFSDYLDQYIRCHLTNSSSRPLLLSNI